MRGQDDSVANNLAFGNTGQSNYREDAATLRSNGGDVGGGSEMLVVSGTLGAAHGKNRGLGQENEIDLLVFGGNDTSGERSVAASLTAHPTDDKAQPTQTFGVRRLTPRECERLQNFPDDWTAWGIDASGQRVEMSDSARYRMTGNAVCRAVSAWLDRRIARYGYD